MLIKQFSLRWMLIAVTLAGFACLAFAAAVHGQLWTAGLVIALVGLVIGLVVQGLVFAVVWCLGRAMAALGRPARD